MGETSSEYRCGTIAIVGQPNVGKSTLLNALVGQKVSITSTKPQTTRNRISGILTTPAVQYIFVDTPGFQTRHGGTLNRLLNRSVRKALEGVDVILLVVEAGVFGEDDRAVVRLLPRNVPAFLIVNKTDRLSEPSALAPFLQRAATEFEFAEVVPVSASKGRNLKDLLRTLARYLPHQPPMFEADTLTDRSERFLAAELIREKLFRSLGDELPYACTVTIDRFTEEKRLKRIHAAILVGKESHKSMVIGKDGAKLKAIATAARLDMEKLFGGKVFLETWVKVRRDWTEDAALLRQLGLANG
jgi:GTP-binding protein Era